MLSVSYVCIASYDAGVVYVVTAVIIICGVHVYAQVIFVAVVSCAISGFMLRCVVLLSLLLMFALLFILLILLLVLCLVRISL